MKSTHTRIAALLLFTATACASSGGGSKSDEYLEKLRTRASFDLGCEPQVFQMTVMDTHPSIYGPLPTNVGVSGCNDQRAVYMMDITTGDYVLNSVTSPNAGAEAATVHSGDSPTTEANLPPS